MWKLVLVQGPNVTYFDANGMQRKSFPEFGAAIAAVLKEGYEPFGADSGNTVLVWFRLRVS